MFEWLKQVVERLARRRPSPRQPSLEPMRPLAEVVADMQELIRVEVVAGYASERELWQRAVEAFQDERPAAELIPHARALTAHLLEQQAREQRSWPELTDCDRLDAAFAALERRGLVSRQNWSCCSSCGTSEIEQLMQDRVREGRPVRGYVFFHEQDTLAATEGMGLFLSYGSRHGDEAGALAIARIVVAELERCGLRTEWNGHFSRRIQVALDWQRRRRAQRLGGA